MQTTSTSPSTTTGQPATPLPVEIDLRAAATDLVSLAYEQILREIMDGAIQPGAPLRVDHLAKRYNISQTPIKHAIAQLVGKGLLEHVPNRGMRVHVLDETEFREVVDARLMCELHAAREGLVVAPKEMIERVLASVRAYEAVAFQRRDNIHAWHDALVRADSELHSSLVALAGNERISSWHAHLNLLLYGRHIIARRDLRTIPRRTLDRTVRVHREIGDAITARDVSRTEALLRSHIATQLELAGQASAP